MILTAHFTPLDYITWLEQCDPAILQTPPEGGVSWGDATDRYSPLFRFIQAQDLMAHHIGLDHAAKPVVVYCDLDYTYAIARLPDWTHDIVRDYLGYIGCWQTMTPTKAIADACRRLLKAAA